MSKTLRIPVRVASVGHDYNDQPFVRFDHVDERGELLTRDATEEGATEKVSVSSKLAISEADAAFFGAHIFKPVTLVLQVEGAEPAECPTCGR